MQIRIYRPYLPLPKTILAIIAILLCFTSYAAFPVTVNIPHPHTTFPIAANRIANTEPGEQEHKKTRSYTTTLGLCAVFGLLGAHRFYLGYYWQGFLQLFITSAFLAGILALAPSLIFGLALLTITILPMLGLILWVIVDFLRILQNTLLPRNGRYR